MWKIVIVMIIAAVLDLRKVSFKEMKKEIILYVILCVITVSMGIYYMNPDHMTLASFMMDFIKK